MNMPFILVYALTRTKICRQVLANMHTLQVKGPISLWLLFNQLLHPASARDSRVFFFFLIREIQ